MKRVKRLPAVNGRELTKEQLLDSTTTLARYFATPGMIGCYLSHKEFWNKTATGSSPYQLVLEDDVILADDFTIKLQDAVMELEECEETKNWWDVLMVGALGCVEPRGKYGLNRVHAFVGGGGRKVRQYTKHCHSPRRPFGTHAYVLSKRGAAKLLQRASLASYHVDAVAWGLQDLNLLVLHPMIAHQAFEAPSTIGAVTNGFETHLPNWVLDKYTGATFQWAFNEPVIRVPCADSILSVGRALSLGLVGLVAGVALRKQAPWLLPAHLTAILAMFVFVRIMVMPAS